MVRIRNSIKTSEIRSFKRLLLKMAFDEEFNVGLTFVEEGFWRIPIRTKVLNTCIRTLHILRIS